MEYALKIVTFILQRAQASFPSLLQPIVRVAWIFCLSQLQQTEHSCSLTFGLVLLSSGKKEERKIKVD
jgi:hypothetical protein